MNNAKEMAAYDAAKNLSNQNKENDKKDGKKRKPIPAIWKVVNKAKFTFDAQLTKNNDVKLACIEHHIASEFKDVDKFWSDYIEEVNRLVDSKKYEWECGVLGVASNVLATHIVFLGSATINRVLKHGVRDTLGTDYKLYKDSFIPKDAEKYILDYATISDSVAELETGVLSQLEIDEKYKDVA